MLKVVNAVTRLYEKVIDDLKFRKGPHSRSSLVDEQTIVGLELSNLLDELDKKI